VEAYPNSGADLKISLLTNEWPPRVYGGAGVRVVALSKELRRLVDLEVRCFGEEREDALAFTSAPRLADANPSFRASRPIF